MKHHGRQVGTARRLVGRPHGALQITRLDQRQPRWIHPVLGKPDRKKFAAIAARGRIIDPDNPASTILPGIGSTARQPERKSGAGTNVARQRAAHFVQSATDEATLKVPVNRNCAQRQWL